MCNKLISANILYSYNAELGCTHMLIHATASTGYLYIFEKKEYVALDELVYT